MKASKIKYARIQCKDLDIIKSNCTASEYVFMHFEDPIKMSYRDQKTTTFSNACVIFSPGEYKRFSSKSACVYDYVCLSSDITEILQSYQIETDRVYYTKNHEFITDIVRKLETEIKHQNRYTDELCECLLNELFIYLSREVKLQNEGEQINAHTKDQLKRLRRLLHTNYTKKWEISEMAQCINISSSYLYYTYKKLFGVSPLQDLINIRMQYARDMLIESTKSINDIAVALGYSNPSHFIRQFTKNVGVPPLKYRNSNMP